ncbi:flagellar biosynthesis repressor FlbT [Pseudovibrio exalbescens]|uniref:Flagellar biosynthesis repressor FlbT n=1 Tax=Pseudovibrio exalbescens TaxID=197461 RepID=A0A1U7JKQ5_9HYPH|nr:flagellar biosynthesis repressor FlbT [Pseudovibrio exalbescens]OKL45309.1 flagellar biosynthesis repressor FlbT [Pseudovibrio exalbescens]
MALKVELKPGEKLIIGESMITNGNHRARLFIEGSAPILREKDIQTVDSADSPAKRIYLAVQIMYLEQKTDTVRDEYFKLIGQIIEAAPSTVPYVTEISKFIIAGNFYKALKEARKLIDYERTLIGHVSASNPSLPE